MSVTQETIRAELEEGVSDEGVQRRTVECLLHNAGVESPIVEDRIKRLLCNEGYTLGFSAEDLAKIVERCHLECSLQFCRSNEQRHKNLIINDLYEALTPCRYSSLELFNNSQKVNLSNLIPPTV